MFEIIKGHDGGACFWIQPVKVHSQKCFGWDAVEECPEEEISLDEEDVFTFLRYFFEKHFDPSLVYNRERKDDIHGSGGTMDASFEWYLTHNFYNYESANKMIADIETYANELERTELDCVPEEYLKYYLIAFNESTNISNWDQNTDALKPAANLPLVADYCRKVAQSIQTMMERKPDWPLISIMGP